MRTTLLRAATVLVIALVVGGGSLLAYGSVFGFDGPTGTATPTTPTVPGPADRPTAPSTVARPSTTVRLPTTTTRPPVRQRQPAATKLPGGTYATGSSGPAVLAYEQRLAALRFDPGPIDGRFDQDTFYAVQTVQKLFGLPITGAIDQPTRFVLSAFKYRAPLVTGPQVEPDRVEVDLDRQVLTLYQGGQVRLITTTSTGSGQYFCGGDDGCQYAVTPTGRYTFQWFYNGWRKSKLGQLYKPYYFNGGIAVHGYPSVPAWPASHGCVRIPMRIADYFHTLVRNGSPVYVVGTPSGPVAPPTGAPPTTTSTTTHPPTTAPPTTAPRTTTTKPRATTTTRPTTTTSSPTTTQPTTTTT